MVALVQVSCIAGGVAATATLPAAARSSLERQVGAVGRLGATASWVQVDAPDGGQRRYAAWRSLKWISVRSFAGMTGLSSRWKPFSFASSR